MVREKGLWWLPFEGGKQGSADRIVIHISWNGKKPYVNKKQINNQNHSVLVQWNAGNDIPQNNSGLWHSMTGTHHHFSSPLRRIPASMS